MEADLGTGIMHKITNTGLTHSAVNKGLQDIALLKLVFSSNLGYRRRGWVTLNP